MPITITALPTGEPDLGAATARTVVADAPHAYPCRRCMRDAEVGERLLLVSYDPFAVRSPYAGEGPVFVHAEQCPLYEWDGRMPDLLLRRLLAVRTYDGEGMMIDAEVVDGIELERALGRMFDRSGCAFGHVHYARPGCFACRVDNDRA